MNLFANLVLWGSAIYHLFVGTIAMTSVQFMRRTGKKLYAIQLPEKLDPRYEYTWKPLGAYALFTAAVSWKGAISQDADLRFFVLRLLAGLFLLRAFSRLVYRDLFTEAFEVPFQRSLINIGFNVVLSAAMIAVTFFPAS